MEDTVVLIIGGRNARAHALSLVYEQSPHVGKIIVAPGNDLIGYRRDKEVVVDGACDPKSVREIERMVSRYHPDIIDLADDDAVASDAADVLRTNSRQVFAPGREASRLEWDKADARRFMRRHWISSPEFRVFGSASEADPYLCKLYAVDPRYLCFVKARGLAAGKGALKAESLEQARERVRQMKNFGPAGETFLIEQGFRGDEFSLSAISDGIDFYRFKLARDYKRHLPFDEGDQTGGMGAVAPLSGFGEQFLKIIEDELIGKAIRGMEEEGMPYQGILYAGGMIVPRGQFRIPYCIEFNARWGDPEIAVVLLGLTVDYLELVQAVMSQRLGGFLLGHAMREDEKYRVAVVGASRGYPGDYSAVRGKRIYGIEEVMQLTDVTFLSAGITMSGGKFYADGGRLFTIVGKGDTVYQARTLALHAMSMIFVEGNNLHYRSDIAWQEMEACYRDQ